MPYIKQENRKKFQEALWKLGTEIISDGDLNYIITTLIHYELLKKGMNYQNINNLIGVLECAKLELYRKIAAPYEDIKMEENGSISDLDLLNTK